ncbi:unnamed protein product [Linum trigynum]|uniref:Uncharacterized protein n=1 Tax=Linum trigynum TaxID=586398 RepID=A0AAV2CG20_9ROSI
MREALSSLLSLSAVIGRLLWATLIVILSSSLINQVRCRHHPLFGDFRIREGGKGRYRRCRSAARRTSAADPSGRIDCMPLRRVLANRKRKRMEALSEYVELSFVISVKRCRKLALKGWRFWLPPSSMLDGDVLSQRSIPKVNEQHTQPEMGPMKNSCGSGHAQPFGDDGLPKPSGVSDRDPPAGDRRPSPPAISSRNLGESSDAVFGSESSCTNLNLQSRVVRPMLVTAVGKISRPGIPVFGTGQLLGIILTNIRENQ